jgi:hypothetical protein
VAIDFGWRISISPREWEIASIRHSVQHLVKPFPEHPPR